MMLVHESRILKSPFLFSLDTLSAIQNYQLIQKNPMKTKNTPRYYSSHINQPQKLPDILSNKSGFLKVLHAQQSRKSKREEYQKIVENHLNQSSNSFFERQKSYEHRTKQIDQRITLVQLQAKKNTQILIKQNGNVMKKAQDNKESMDKKQAKARKDMFAKETQKLQKSVLLRSSFFADRSRSSHVSRSSKSGGSLENSVLIADPAESLAEINNKLERARKQRQQKLNNMSRTRTKLDEKRQQIYLKAVKNAERFANKSLHTYLKSLKNVKIRLSDLKLSNRKHYEFTSKQQNDKKDKAKAKFMKQNQENIRKMLKQNQTLEKKIENASKTRVMEEQAKKNDLMNRTKDSMTKALTRHNTKKSMQFIQKEAILKNHNKDYKVFKVFKCELSKSVGRFDGLL